MPNSMQAKYDLDQTTIRAPADGYVSSLALNKGDRAAPLKSVMSFIVSDRIQLVGIFSQNGFQTIKPGAQVQFALSNNPGHLYSSTIGGIVSGIGEGQIASSGMLARVTSLPMTVGISSPDQPAQGNRSVRFAARHVGNGNRLRTQFKRPWI